jgi:NTE family protein
MRGLVFVLSLFVSACATATAPINAPLGGLRADVEGRAPVGDDLIVLALSGGGARAASFHLGVLQALRDTPGRDGRPLSEHIALITSVSGGSVLAAYYGLNGDAGLDTFDAAYLAREWRVRGPGSPFGLAGAFPAG